MPRDKIVHRLERRMLPREQVGLRLADVVGGENPLALWLVHARKLLLQIDAGRDGEFPGNLAEQLAGAFLGQLELAVERQIERQHEYPTGAKHPREFGKN